MPSRRPVRLLPILILVLMLMVTGCLGTAPPEAAPPPGESTAADEEPTPPTVSASAAPEAPEATAPARTELKGTVSVRSEVVCAPAPVGCIIQADSYNRDEPAELNGTALDAWLNASWSADGPFGERLEMGLYEKAATGRGDAIARVTGRSPLALPFDHTLPPGTYYVAFALPDSGAVKDLEAEWVLSFVEE